MAAPLILRPQTDDQQIVDSIRNGKYASDYSNYPRLVFDLGAHIGAWTRKTLDEFPLANAVCVEPCVKNLELLAKNLKTIDPNRYRIVGKFVASWRGAHAQFVPSARRGDTGGGGISSNANEVDGQVSTSVVMSDLVEVYGCPDVIKINCAEAGWIALNSIFTDPRIMPSMIVGRVFSETNGEPPRSRLIRAVRPQPWDLVITDSEDGFATFKLTPKR